MDDQALKKAALDYHEFPKPGKISVTPSKQLVNQRDLALAYSPGVAAPCLEIEREPHKVARYTARGNLVAVITNGTAVLGLGNIGPLASKPVMEGKGVLFKKFAGVDVFDIEIAENDPDKLVDIIASLEPTFGGINLEDIKAPECFYIEQKLRERMKIPVFHDDSMAPVSLWVPHCLTHSSSSTKKSKTLKLWYRVLAPRPFPVSICCVHWASTRKISSQLTPRVCSPMPVLAAWTPARPAMLRTFLRRS